MSQAKYYLKHTMSELRDLPIEYRIDAERREIVLAMQSFDSALVAEFVENVLPTRHGVVAFADDNEKDEFWQTPLPPYRLVVDLAGTPYGARVVKLFEAARRGPVVTVMLENPAVERKRRCEETAAGVMEALHEADIEAWVVGTVASRDNWHRNTVVDILVWNRTESFLERHPEVDTIVTRPTWRAPIDVQWAGPDSTKWNEWTARPHLVWDAVRRKLCQRHEDEHAGQQRLADARRGAVPP